MELLVYQFVPTDTHFVAGEHQKEPTSIHLTPAPCIPINIDDIPFQLSVLQTESPMSFSLFSYMLQVPLCGLSLDSLEGSCLS